MWVRLSKVLCVAVLGLVLFDTVADAGCCDDTKSAATACHGCLCAAHVVPQGVVQAEPVPVRADFIAYELTMPALPAPKSLLRPPCLAA